MSFILVGTITLLYAVLNFPFLGAMTQLINMLPGGTGDSSFLRRRPGRMVMTVAGMIGVVVVNLGFKNLLALFGFCGGWGISFVVYFIPSVRIRYQPTYQPTYQPSPLLPQPESQL